MAKDIKEIFRMIPSVDRLLDYPDLREISDIYPRNLILRAINQFLDEVRKKIGTVKGSDDSFDLSIESISEKIIRRLEILAQSSLRNVINATGIVVHTNLGRSILGEKVLNKFKPLSGSYCNLEYDLDQGKRGSRYSHVEGILKELTSAEAAMVVNNNTTPRIQETHILVGHIICELVDYILFQQGIPEEEILAKAGTFEP